MPQTCTTRDYPLCGFTRKTMNFCWAMVRGGHEVFLYGGEANEAECTVFVPCITAAEQRELCLVQPYIYPSWNPRHPVWVKYNQTVANEINSRSSLGDLVCVLGGNCHATLRDALPHLKVVEYGIGYTGHFADYRVWESHVWRAFCLGKHYTTTPAPSPRDTVIPAFFDASDYPHGKPRQDYLLYLGRVTRLKGIENACKAARMAGKRLLVAGYGDKKLVTDGAEYLGPVDHATKLTLLSEARALICPTVGLEAFGNVACEAQLCGTPVICTNWGGFTETVDHGSTGWRCETVEDMAAAVAAAFSHPEPLADPWDIRHRAFERWDRSQVIIPYTRYFERIATAGC